MKSKKMVIAIILTIIIVTMPMTSVFAQIDPGDPLYEPVGGVTVAGAVEQLYELGV